MENYEKFEQLLLNHAFKELNAEEKLLARKFVNSEEEYESLRQSGQMLDSYFIKKMDISPSSQVWHRIRNTWKGSTSPIQSHYWIKVTMPAYATLLLLIGVGSLCWFGGSRYSSQKILVQQVRPQVDTVFIASKPDTVVRERIIYVEPETKTMPAVEVSNKSLQERPTSKGVSMKEKEELEKLLVSGSI